MNKTNKSSRVIIPEESTAIRMMEYNTELNRLTVRFSNGGMYQYEDVPKSLFGELCSSESLGQTFNRIIAGKFDCTKLMLPEYTS